MKKSYLECLRIVAIILLIYNHTKGLGYDLYQRTTDARSCYRSVFMIPVCKTAVPIFLMISGATLLGKTEGYRALFFNRIVRYAGIILFWGTLQYLRYVRTGKEELSVGVWWYNVYSNPRLETYWFLYLYLGFLLLLPLLRKAAAGMREQDYRYLLALSSVLTLTGYFTDHFIHNSVFALRTVLLQVVKYIVNIKGNDFLIAVLYTLSMFVLGVCLVLVLKKIPILKRLMLFVTDEPGAATGFAGS